MQYGMYVTYALKQSDDDFSEALHLPNGTLLSLDEGDTVVLDGRA